MGKLEKKSKNSPNFAKKNIFENIFSSFLFCCKRIVPIRWIFCQRQFFCRYFFQKKKFDKKITKKTFPTLAIFNGMDQLEAE